MELSGGAIRIDGNSVAGSLESCGRRGRWERVLWGFWIPFWFGLRPKRLRDETQGGGF